jgi:hypothetical protein
MAAFAKPRGPRSAIATALSLRDFRLIRHLRDPVLPLTVIWVVRRDWPADGAHEFLSPRVDRTSAERALRADVNYWRRSPIRPSVSLARMTLAEYRLHGRAWKNCRSTLCPEPIRR